MNRFLRFAACAMLALLPVPAFAQLPAPYTATYQVSRNGSPLGVATVEFRALPNGRYDLRSHTVGSQGLAAIAGVDLEEHSVLRLADGAPETVAYSYRQKMAWKSRSRDIRVDANARRITYSDKDRDYAPPYRPGVIDRNAITVALMADLAAGKPGDLRYLIPSKDELETWTYRPAGSERLRTPLGDDEAVRIERIRETANGRSTTLWLSKSRGYVPLRILQREPDGETIEMKITALR
jgi:hypothetical protein